MRRPLLAAIVFDLLLPAPAPRASAKLCDLLQIRSDERGTRVRLRMDIG